MSDNCHNTIYVLFLTSVLILMGVYTPQSLYCRGYMLINDNYFSPVFGVADIGEGVQTCQGYHVSIRPSLQGLSLNLGE